MTRPDTAGAAASPSRVPGEGRTVLGAADIGRALRRMAHEIVEAGKGADDLVVLGIPTRGVEVARRLALAIGEIEGVQVPTGVLDVTSHRDDLHLLPAPAGPGSDIPDTGIDGRVVVLCDDVLYSGRTVRAALDALGDIGRPRAVRLAVLVDRGHRELPIRADHVGKNLPTSSAERVEVCLAPIDDTEAVRIVPGGRTS